MQSNRISSVLQDEPSEWSWVGQRGLGLYSPVTINHWMGDTSGREYDLEWTCWVFISCWQPRTVCCSFPSNSGSKSFIPRGSGWSVIEFTTNEFAICNRPHLRLFSRQYTENTQGLPCISNRKYEQQQDHEVFSVTTLPEASIFMNCL